MLKKFFFAVFLVPVIAFADCPKCGKESVSDRICPSCIRSGDQANAEMAGQMLGGLFTMMAMQQQQEAEAKKAAALEKKKEIEARNAAILHNLVYLEINDKDEGRHNLGVQLLPVPSSSSLKIFGGKDSFGAYVLADMPAKLFDIPIKFGLDKTQLPGAIDFTVLRQSSSAAVGGNWKIKNVPFKFFYRGATMLHWEIKLISEDELLMRIVTDPEKKEVLKVTLVNNTPFDYAHEAGVDGQGLNSRVYTRGIGTGPVKKGKKRGISW